MWNSANTSNKLFSPGLPKKPRINPNYIKSNHLHSPGVPRCSVACSNCTISIEPDAVYQTPRQTILYTITRPAQNRHLTSPQTLLTAVQAHRVPRQAGCISPRTSDEQNGHPNPPNPPNPESSRSSRRFPRKPPAKGPANQSATPGNQPGSLGENVGMLNSNHSPVAWSGG